MERKYVTCPDTGHLEEIEIEVGQEDEMKVVSCTRFNPACEVGCASECARRMERRARSTRSGT